MNFPSSLLSCFTRCFPPLSLVLFLLLHHFLYPDFLNFQLSAYVYSLCFLVLLTESLFLFFYRERNYPEAVELGLLFVSALFLSSLLVIIKAPTVLFFVFLFTFIQALSLISLKKLFQTTVFVVYLSFLFPLFLSAGAYSFEQISFLIPFCLLVLVFLFFYLLVFYFMFELLHKKTPDTILRSEDQNFLLSLSPDFSRKLKPVLNQVLRQNSRFEHEIEKNKELLKHIEPQNVTIDFSSTEKIKKDLNSLNSFISNFIDYTELFYEKLKTELISLNSLLKDSLQELENHPKKPRALNLKDCLKFEQNFELEGSTLYLKKAFKNIIVNAFEAHSSKEKNPELSIYIFTSRDFLAIHFIDKGQGIEAEENQKVFVPFVSKKFGLGGLGLSYAKKVIELHKGDIQINREDKKTKVIVRLPLTGLRKPTSSFLKKSPLLKKKKVAS